MAMRGILLAGGLGTRLYPITHTINKHLLPLYDRPMYYWPLMMLINSGIREIAIVSGPPTGTQVQESLEYFPNHTGVKLIYVNQDKPLGMPHAIYCCRDFIKNNPFIMSVGDNIFENDFKKEAKSFKSGAVAYVRKVKDPENFGVAIYGNKKNLLDIVEKPKKHIGNWAVGAPYIFDNTAFAKIKKLKASARGELEITDLLRLYISDNNLKLVKDNGVWIDTGTHERLLTANIYAKKLSRLKKWKLTKLFS